MSTKGSLYASLMISLFIINFLVIFHFTDTTDEESFEDSVRNVSGLDPNQYRQYHGEAPILDYKDLRMRRKIFAKYGMKSGEDPRIMWPARSDILRAEIEEKEETKSLQQRLQDIKLQKEQEIKERLQRL